MSEFNPPLSEQQVRSYKEDGYIIVKNLFNQEETDLLLSAAEEDKLLHEKAFDVKDKSGKNTRLSLWNHPGDDIWGAVCRGNRIVGGMEQLLGGEVYHYHSKLMLKEPREGGAWEWHQDYGYWYENGCLYPYMGSCLIALNQADKGNGCLQVIKGSHHMGRVEHGKFGGQFCADPERVEKALEQLELVHCELEPGSGLFFHGNLLHRSDDNTSERSRWSLICCYNAARNNPFKEHHHPQYTPLKKMPDSALSRIGMKLSSSSGNFMDKNDNTNSRERE